MPRASLFLHDWADAVRLFRSRHPGKKVPATVVKITKALEEYDKWEDVPNGPDEAKNTRTRNKLLAALRLVMQRCTEYQNKRNEDGDQDLTAYVTELDELASDEIRRVERSAAGG